MKINKNNKPRIEFINYITLLMEQDKIEEALVLINKHFKSFTTVEKKLMTVNILEATKQYFLSSNDLPEEYYDFLASDESNEM